MSLITKMRKQKAIWYRSLGINRFGTHQYANGIVVACRWDDEQAIQSTGDEETLDLRGAFVYVDREMHVNDVLVKAVGDAVELEVGSEVVLGDGVSAIDLEGARVIQKFKINPNLKATESLLTATV